LLAAVNNPPTAPAADAIFGYLLMHEKYQWFSWRSAKSAALSSQEYNSR